MKRSDSANGLPTRAPAIGGREAQPQQRGVALDTLPTVAKESVESSRPATQVPQEFSAPTSPPSTNVLNDSIRRVRELNPQLADSIEREVNALRDSRSFGLVFERRSSAGTGTRHVPSTVSASHMPTATGLA